MQRHNKWHAACSTQYEHAINRGERQKQHVAYSWCTSRNMQTPYREITVCMQSGQRMTGSAACCAHCTSLPLASTCGPFHVMASVQRMLALSTETTQCATLMIPISLAGPLRDTHSAIPPGTHPQFAGTDQPPSTATE